MNDSHINSVILIHQTIYDPVGEIFSQGQKVLYIVFYKALVVKLAKHS